MTGYQSKKDMAQDKLAQPAQEPVAWMRPSEEGYDSAFRDHSTVMVCTGNPWVGWIPLYTTPPAAQPDDPTGQAPCAKHCESIAYEIVILGLKVDIERMKAAQRTWVGLTDEEKGFCAAPTYVETVARTEAKLKEKNT